MSLFPSVGSVQRTSASSDARRKKVALEPGHSPLDWANLQGNLRGTEQFPLKISTEELGRHNTEADAWTVIRGKVYNITPYLKFHPGGVQDVMKVAGRDGTKLFTYTHAWVNVDHMLAKCMVGFYVPSA